MKKDLTAHGTCEIVLLVWMSACCLQHVSSSELHQKLKLDGLHNDYQPHHYLLLLILTLLLW